MLALVLVLVGTASALVALYLARVPETTTEVEPPVPPPQSKTVSTVKFVVVPADSTITIEGKPMHTGSPWDVDLAPGAHQIEIHHDGYKSWLTSTDIPRGETLTLRVVLDPFDSAVVIDATLPPVAAPADHPGATPMPSDPEPRGSDLGPDKAPATPDATHPPNGSAAPPASGHDLPEPVSPPPPSPPADSATPASVSPTRP